MAYTSNCHKQNIQLCTIMRHHFYLLTIQHYPNDNLDCSLKYNVVVNGYRYFLPLTKLVHSL